MFIATVIVSALLAVLLFFSALGKLSRKPKLMDSMAKVGVPADRVWMLAVLEIAAAIGLVVGLFWWPIGVAAAIGAVLYFVGAVIAHVRKKDPQIQPAAVILVVAIAALVLRSVSA